MFRVILILWCCGLAAAAAGIASGQSFDATIPGATIPNTLTSGTEPAVRWHCELLPVAGEQWVLRCDDLEVLFDDDPALADASPVATRYVLIRSIPLDPRMAAQLVRAMLCHGALCGVSLKLDYRQPRVIWIGPLPPR